MVSRAAHQAGFGGKSQAHPSLLSCLTFPTSTPHLSSEDNDSTYCTGRLRSLQGKRHVKCWCTLSQMLALLSRMPPDGLLAQGLDLKGHLTAKKWKVFCGSGYSLPGEVLEILHLLILSLCKSIRSIENVI